MVGFRGIKDKFIWVLGDYLIFAQALLSEDCPLFLNAGTHKLFFANVILQRDGYSEKLPWLVDGVIRKACLWTWRKLSRLLCIYSPPTGAVVMTNQFEEEVYNEKMMELIFGAYDSKKLFSRCT